MTTTHPTIIALLGIFLLAASAPVSAESPAYPGIYFAADVEQQFRSLARRGDGLAFNIGTLPESVEPSLCKHLQGMARLPGTGTPYLFISRSGNDPGFSCVTGFEDDVPGDLFVVRLGSRDTTGERLRSNRLVRDWPARFVTVGTISVPWTKPGDSRDRVARYVTLNGAWPAYMHPGGMQIVDDVLAVAVEAPFDGAAIKPTAILFVDVSTPESPRLLSQWPGNSSPSDVGPAGLVGLTPVVNSLGSGLRYLMITTGKDNGVVRMWRSLSTSADPNGPTDLRSPGLDWQQVGRRDYDELEAAACSGGEDWPEGRDAYQSLNFVREGGLTGPLYLVGGRNTGVAGQGNDILALYRVDVDDYGNPGTCMLKFVNKRNVTSYPFGGHGDSAALSAAGGTYVSPAGELIVYGTEYENDGPFELLPNDSPGARSVRFVEWRNINVVRPDSPTLRPSIQTARNVQVDEGAGTALSGMGRGPITKAWIQLFEDDDAGRSEPGIVDDDDWLQVDYDDWGRDHFDAFNRLDSTTGTDFNDNAGSWRWFAPVGCTVRANEDSVGASTGVFPGRHTRTLPGNGVVNREDDLDQVENDIGDAKMDDKVSSVQFDAIAGYSWPHPGCADYYSAPISVTWDLDGDGSFETSGAQAAFSAATLDGPSQASIHARAQHPTDPTDLGYSDPLTVTVAIRNVPPIVTGLSLRDSLDNEVGSTVPFVLTGLPVTVSASFTDAGRPDRQTASLAWGDGVVDSSSQFASFSDAFGGVTGTLRQPHTYSVGADRVVLLTVTDDDGGSVTAENNLRVLTPAQALAELGALLDALIAGAANADMKRDLEGARHALVGSRPPGSQSGALDQLLAGHFAAADAFLLTALDRLERARQGGANVAALISLVQQVRSAM